MRHYTATVVGHIWQPSVGPCSLDGIGIEAESVREALERVYRDHCGDFQNVIDIELWEHKNITLAAPDGRVVEEHSIRRLVKRFSDEAEAIYADTREEA